MSLSFSFSAASEISVSLSSKGLSLRSAFCSSRGVVANDVLAAMVWFSLSLSITLSTGHHIQQKRSPACRSDRENPNPSEPLPHRTRRRLRRERAPSAAPQACADQRNPPASRRKLERVREAGRRKADVHPL